jgi:hypothetical protein
MKTYSYEEVLEKASEFCISSGIREYCQSYCKGRCCGVGAKDRHCKDNVCHERLACVIMTCGIVRDALRKAIGWDRFMSYYELQDTIEYEIRLYLREELGGGEKNNAYFGTYTLDKIKHLTFDLLPKWFNDIIITPEEKEKIQAFLYNRTVEPNGFN